jgi:hypothetical protein
MNVKGYAVLAALVVLLSASNIEASPISTLTLQSQPGDSVGQGMTFNEVYPQPGDFYEPIPHISATIQGLPSFMYFLLGGDQSIADVFATVIVGTNHLGVPLEPGTYVDAQRAAPATSGHPGLDISFDHRGCNSVTGGFTITDASYDAGGGVSSFAFNFEQHCNGETPALSGTFTYNANATEVPEPAGYWLVGFGMACLSFMRLQRRS